MKLPEFLAKAVTENTTSLGDHPSFPPEDEDTFVYSIIRGTYASVMEDVDTADRKELAHRLDQLITECKKEEESCKEALEQLCSDILVRIFNIPDDTININGTLVSECDMSKYRMVPEATPDFEFEDVDEMRHLSDMIYQRRMINTLMSGISEYYAYLYDLYVQDVWKINPRLMNIYSEIKKYNLALLYNQPDSIKSIERSNSGRVTVRVGNPEERITIEAEGVIFPVLLEYTIRGILEVASLKGLPEDVEKAEYIMGKTDYRLAENWDMRLGIPLWKVYMSVIEKTGYDINEVGVNFVVMELSKLDSDIFNGYLQNVFKKTRKGVDMTKELLGTISYNLEQDDFNNFVKANNTKHSINDSEYTSEELLAEAENQNMNF